MTYFKLLLFTLFLSLKNVIANNASLSVEAFLGTFRSDTLDAGGLVTFSFIMCIAALRNICKKRCPFIPVEPLVILLGIFLGIMDKEFIFQLSIIKSVNPLFLQEVVIPLMLSQACMNCDPNASLKSWFIWFIMLMPLQVIIATITGLSLRLIIDRSWNTTMAVIAGFVFLPIFPSVNLMVLKTVGLKCKTVHSLLSAQMIFSTAICANVIHICEIFELLIFTSYLHLIVHIIRSCFGAIVVGYVVGTLHTFLLRRVTNDPVSMVLTFLSTCLTSSALCNYYHFSGAIGLIVNAILINKERIRISADSEQFLSIFWELLTYVVNCFVLLIFGIFIGLEIIWIAEIKDALFILACYFIIMGSKFFFYILLQPILRYSNTGFQISFRLAMVATWAANFSCLNTVLLLPCFFIKNYTHFSIVLMLYVVGVTFLLYLINVSTLSVMLSCLGLTHVTTTKEHNMTNCLRYILNVRDRTLKRLKLDKFMTDVNWPVVKAGTQITHPYNNILNKEIIPGDDDGDTLAMGYRTATCDNCLKEVNMPPSGKELEEMAREARKRIIMSRKVSYARQFENGMISQEAFRVLTMNSDIALEAPVISLKIDFILKYFYENSFVSRSKKIASRIRQLNDYPRIRPPNGYWRRKCYHIINSFYFYITIQTINCLNFALSMFMFFYHRGLKENPRTITNFHVIASETFLILYTLEILIKMIGMGRPRICCYGIINFFRSHWNKFDFFVYVLSFASTFGEMLYYRVFKINLLPETFFQFQAIVELTRLLRMLRLFIYCYPTIMKLAEYQINSQRTFAYEIGKSYLKSEEEALELLPQIIDITDLRNEIRQEMEQNVLLTSRELAIIQKENPHIAIEVKTRQAFTIILNAMYEGIVHLKTSGWLEDTERAKLSDSVDRQVRAAVALRNIPMNSVRSIFEQIPWMVKDAVHSDLLFAHTLKKEYRPGEYLCLKDEIPKGIYVIISGLFKITYKPQDDILEDLHECGQLPIVDHITTAIFNEARIEYAASGHTIGELCFLTGRPYDSEVIAEVHSEVLLLPKDSVTEIVEKDKDIVTGLEARMWTYLSVRLVTSILLETPAYSSTPTDMVRFALERAVVPTFKTVKIFARSDIIEDVVLIEGFCLDFITRDIYTAPSYIPRNVYKLMLPQSSELSVEKIYEAKLLLIPLKDTSVELLREKILKHCEMAKQIPPAESKPVGRKFTVTSNKSRDFGRTSRGSQKSIISDELDFFNFSTSSSSDSSGGYGQDRKSESKTKLTQSHIMNEKLSNPTKQRRAKSIANPQEETGRKLSQFSGKGMRRETAESIELNIMNLDVSEITLNTTMTAISEDQTRPEVETKASTKSIKPDQPDE